MQPTETARERDQAKVPENLSEMDVEALRRLRLGLRNDVYNMEKLVRIKRIHGNDMDVARDDHARRHMVALEHRKHDLDRVEKQLEFLLRRDLPNQHRLAYKATRLVIALEDVEFDPAEDADVVEALADMKAELGA